jgi:hypothetical protein
MNLRASVIIIASVWTCILNILSGDNNLSIASVSIVGVVVKVIRELPMIRQAILTVINIAVYKPLSVIFRKVPGNSSLPSVI